MKKILSLVGAVIVFTACAIQDYSPKTSSEVKESDSIDMLAIGKLSSKTKMSDWDKDFRPTVALGGLPEVGEYLVIVRCDDGKVVRYCSTITTK